MSLSVYFEALSLFLYIFYNQDKITKLLVEFFSEKAKR